MLAPPEKAVKYRSLDKREGKLELTQLATTGNKILFTKTLR